MCFYYVTFSPSQDGIRFPKQHFIGQSLKLLLFSFFLAFCLISCRHSHQHARKCIVLSFTLSHSKRSLTPTKWNKKQSVKNNSTKTTHGKSLASESRGLNLDTTTTTTSETICVQQEKKNQQERGRIITQPFLQIFFFLHPWSHMAFPTTMPPYYFWFSYFLFFFH